jgi:hypothetical protein
MANSLVRFTYDNTEATASGIYGLITGAAVLVSLHADRAWQAVLAVLVTLLVYWAAERFARIVAGRIHEGHLPTWHTVRRELTGGWEMVTASLLPLLVLVVFRLAGARLVTAELAALACCTLLLGLIGWRMGAEGRLSTPERIVSTLAAAALGGVLVALKFMLH